MSSFKLLGLTPRNWLILLLNIAAIVLLFNACFPEEYQRQYPVFTHGSITEDGYFNPDAEKSVCTTEAIPFTRFRINRDFDDDTIMKLYFYDAFDNLVLIQAVDSTKWNCDFGALPHPDAKSFRIVLESEDGFSDWDLTKLRFSLDVRVSTHKYLFNFIPV